MITKQYGPASGDLQPIYNPLDYKFDSDNKNESGFEYVIDVYNSGTTDKIFEWRMPPRSSDGWCYVKTNKILSNLVSYDKNDTNTFVNSSYSYYPQWMQSTGGNLSLYKFSGSDTEAPFISGDTVNIVTNTTYGDERDLNGDYIIVDNIIVPGSPTYSNVVLGLSYSGVLKSISTTMSRVDDYVPPVMNSGYCFDINVGESYFYSWTASNVDDYLGFVRLNGTSYTSGAFGIDDMVEINTSTYGDNRDLINGYFKVIGITASGIILDMDYSVLGLTGSISSSVLNTTRVVFRDVYTQSGVCCFNGILEHNDFKNYTQDRFQPSSLNTDGEFLLNTPVRTFYDDKASVFIRKNIEVGLDSNCYLNFYNQPISGTPSMYVVFRKFSPLGSSLGLFRTVGTVSNGVINQIGCGPGNLPGLTQGTPYGSGSLPLIQDNIGFYDVALGDDKMNNVSEWVRFTLDRRCKIEDIEMLFMDRYGSLVPMLFNLRMNKNMNVERETYNRSSDGYGSQYDLFDPLETIFNINIEEDYNINSNWMGIDVSDYFEQLFSSPVKWIKLDGEYYSCEILDSSKEIELISNKQLIRYNLRVRKNIKSRTNI